MEKRFRMVKPTLLCVAAVAVMFCTVRGEEQGTEIQNPFIKPCVYKESMQAEWRHVFHHMRTTWDKYFEVYPKELAGFGSTTLDKIRADPAFYLDTNVQIDVYWGRPGTLYRPFIAPFHEVGHVNFSGWAYGSDIWLKEAREQIHLLFYVDRSRKELVEKLSHIPMYTPVHLWVQERSKSEGTPWIEIKGAQIIPETALRETTLRHLELGARQMTRKRFDMAAQAFENALSLQMPVVAETKAWALLGRSQFELRNFREARNAYAEALIRDGGNVTTLIFMARTDEYLMNYCEAKEAAERAVTIAPANPEARAELGLALAMMGDDKAGLRELEFAQKLAPRSQLPEANRNRAIIYLKLGKLELAKQELSQAVILRATDPVLQIELGDVLMTMKQYDDAKRGFGFARDLAPNRPEAYLRFAQVARIQGDLAKKENKLDDAKKFYTEALDNVRNSLKYDDTNSDARALELDMLKELGREKEAEKSADTALEKFPGNLKFINTLYESAVTLGHWDVMERAANLALKVKPDVKYFCRLGNVLANRPNADLKGAALNYENALMIDGQNGTAWFELAQIRRSLSDLEGAVAAADKATEFMNSPEARVLAARAHLDRDLADPVTVDIGKVLVDEAKDEVSRAQARSILGAALYRNGDVDGALDVFAKADVVMKDSPDHQYWYGLALLQKKDLEGAKSRLKSVVDLSRSGTQPNALAERLSQKAIGEIEKLEPGYQAKLNETPKSANSGNVAGSPTGKEPAKDVKPIRKVLPPIIEDDGPQPISTDANRTRQ